jgi:hypothetical protein
VPDAVCVGLIGVFFHMKLRRRGSLWFALGFHAAFDRAAPVLLAAPNAGMEGRGKQTPKGGPGSFQGSCLTVRRALRLSDYAPLGAPCGRPR